MTVTQQSCYHGLTRPVGGTVARWGSHGDRCRHPGCGALLSDFNDLDRCACHGVGGKKRPLRKRGEARALPEAATEPVRCVTLEEVSMAAKRRRQAGATRAAVLALLAHGEVTVGEVAEAVGVNGPNAHKYLTELLECGKVSRKKNGRGYVYALRPQHVFADFGDVQYPENDPAAAPSAAAPEPAPEQPAEPPAPAPAPSREPAAAGACEDMCAGISEMAQLLPFAGWSEPRIGRIELSEVAVLGYLEEMEEEARERVLTYAISRWYCPDVKGAGQ